MMSSCSDAGGGKGSRGLKVAQIVVQTGDLGQLGSTYSGGLIVSVRSVGAPPS